MRADDVVALFLIAALATVFCILFGVCFVVVHFVVKFW